MGKAKSRANGDGDVFPRKNKEGRITSYRGAYVGPDGRRRYVSGRTHEDRRLQEILGTDRDWTNDNRWVEAAFTKGLYAQQLAWLHASIPADRLLVLQYERCVSDPAAQLARTYAFLGLPPHELRPDELATARNVTRADKLDLEPERRALLVRLYRPDVAELSRLVPDLDLALWPDFA